MHLRMATKFSATILGVLALAALSSALALLCSWQVAGLLHVTVNENLASARTAEELEIALLEQRGFVSWYVLDRGDRLWLEELRRKKQGFDACLTKAQDMARTPAERHILARLEDVYRDYDAKRQEVVSLYDKGDLEAARGVLAGDVNRLSSQAYDLCEEFISADDQNVDHRVERAYRHVQRTTWMVGISMVMTLALGALLFWVFLHGVLRPLRGMLAEARLATGDVSQRAGELPTDELHAVGRYLHALVDDVMDTRSTLESSRSRLMNAEKLASVGKLAASVAHEMRNPLTAMKMWLFSIRKAVEADPDLNRKCGILAEEIIRLEHIVRNFLEFSRPRELKLGRRQVAELLDRTLELFRHHIEGKGIRLISAEATGLPPVMADPEQLRQVLSNLLDNAADATPEGGEIRIEVSAEAEAGGRPMVVVRIHDTGSGMPAEVQRRVLEPFFTTKDDGTGLGLCIATEIMARHKGRLVLEASTERGTTFAVWIPVAPPEGKGDE
jgi:signal transduction histidine kinase